MKNAIRMMMTGVVAVGLGLSSIGCSDEASVKQQDTIKGPEGTTTITKETKVQESGKNPPAPAPAHP